MKRVIKKYMVEGVEVPSLNDYIRIKKHDPEFTLSKILTIFSKPETPDDKDIKFKKTFDSYDELNYYEKHELKDKNGFQTVNCKMDEDGKETWTLKLFKKNFRKKQSPDATPIKTLINKWEILKPITPEEVLTKYNNRNYTWKMLNKVLMLIEKGDPSFKVNEFLRNAEYIRAEYFKISYIICIIDGDGYIEIEPDMDYNKNDIEDIRRVVKILIKENPGTEYSILKQIIEENFIK